MQFSAEDVWEAAQEGVEFPSPENEEVEGFAYKMCYLHFRVRPELHLIDVALDNFFKHQLEPQVARLTELLEPTYGDYLAYHSAVPAHREYEQFGSPEPGGWLHQPAWWLCVIDCALVAKERAGSQNMREEAWFNRRKAEQARQNSQSADAGFASTTAAVRWNDLLNRPMRAF